MPNSGSETGLRHEDQPGISLPINITAVTAMLALALALIAGAGAALYQKTRPANYQSVAVLLIDQPVAVANVPDAGPLQKLQLLRYQYAGLIKTQTITEPVATQVNLPVDQVTHDLSALVDPTSFTINVYATAKSSTESDTVAQAAAAQLTSYVAKSQAHIGVVVQNRVVLNEVTQPAAGVRVSVSTTKILLPALIAFILVGGGFLIVADLLRRRW